MTAMLPQILSTDQYLYEKDGWRITEQKYNSDNWAYIVHDCEDTSEKVTRCIVLQAPRSRLSHVEYIKQMTCQICKKRPPDDVITVWTLLSWDMVSK